MRWRTFYSMKRLVEDLADCRILILDDEPANTQLLERVLVEGGFGQYRSLNDSRQALSVFGEFQQDLLLLDVAMPYLDGYLLLEEFRGKVAPDMYLPILVLTADI